MRIGFLIPEVSNDHDQNAQLVNLLSSFLPSHFSVYFYLLAASVTQQSQEK